MKLRFFFKKDKKVYTLKEEVDGKETSNAHYKYIKVKDAPRSK